MALNRPKTARTLVLDTEAVSALARKQRGMAERMTAAQRCDYRVVIPSIVLAEVMTGAASDAAVWGVVKSFPVIDIVAVTAARAGAMRAKAESVRRKKRDLTIDAVIAAVASELSPSIVLTADAGDLSLLLDGVDVKVSSL